MSIIKEINSLISNNKELISNWLFEKTKESEPPFYCLLYTSDAADE